jgi:uncharacterized protein (TIGR01244 family)
MNARGLVVVVALSVSALGCSGSSSSSDTGASVAPSTEAAKALPNATMVGSVLTGGQPSPAQYEALQKDGYTTVISLRTAEEDGAQGNAAEVEALGMTYVNIPIAGAEGLTRENVQRFSDALEQAAGPVVAHCASGNRVGAMFGLKAHWIDGATPTEALAIAKNSGMTGLEETLKQILGLVE